MEKKYRSCKVKVVVKNSCCSGAMRESHSVKTNDEKEILRAGKRLHSCLHTHRIILPEPTPHSLAP